jgi:hypothetical protein
MPRRDVIAPRQKAGADEELPSEQFHLVQAPRYVLAGPFELSDMQTVRCNRRARCLPLR